jgi:hypothetical protein
VIAVNDAYLIAPWAEVLYFSDARWHEWHRERAEFKAFAGQKVSIEGTGARVDDADVYMLHVGYPDRGLSRDPGALATGGNSGYQAIGLAVLAGVERIVLLGFDMKAVGDRHNWHTGRPVKPHRSVYPLMLRAFGTLPRPLAALGVEVLNATPDSALDCFPRVALESVLPDPATAALSA